MNENSMFKIYVEKLWVSGDTCLHNVANLFERFDAKNQISKKRKEFLKKLENEGFIVTTDKDEIDENTICLVMDETALCENDVPVEEYKKMFDQKMKESGGENFYYPYTVKIEEYFENPFFPAVFKNEIQNGGVDKFLIENNEQLEIIKKFYNEYHEEEPFKEAFECSVIQQFLKTPTKYATYLRVLAGGSGEVMGASLKFSARSSSNINQEGLLEKVFLDPKSNYFINAQKPFNYYSEGQNISFSQPSYSDEKKSILKAHGLDVENLSIPSQVLDVCENIMDKCNRELGVLCGFDFLLNESDGKWYYLENQAFPAIDEWASENRVTLPNSKKLKGYLQQLEIEMNVRYEALMMLVNKRKKQMEENSKVRVLNN